MEKFQVKTDYLGRHRVVSNSPSRGWRIAVAWLANSRGYPTAMRVSHADRGYNLNQARALCRWLNDRAAGYASKTGHA